MTVESCCGRYISDDQKLLQFHNTRGNPRDVVCIKDDPPMTGFGRQLKVGDRVEINGTVSRGDGFEVAVPSECAFYDYTYFDPADDFFNK